MSPDFNINAMAIAKDELIQEAARSIAEFEHPATWDECTVERQKAASALATDLLTMFAVPYIQAASTVATACDTFMSAAVMSQNYGMAASFQERHDTWRHIAHTMSHWTKGSSCDGE